MKYILTAGWEDGVADLTKRLVQELAAGKRVLWLTSGGSNIPASIQIMENISSELSSKLSVSLVDERYGYLGHAESNWEKLISGGFPSKQATLLPVLHTGSSFSQTINSYQQLIEQAFKDNEIVIAQLGIGQDGHIAGILPDSLATTETAALVVGYQAPPLSRLTLTFPAIRHITAAYVFAFGVTKQRVLLALQSGDGELTSQPAQVLNELSEVYIYNDQVGEHA